jgi:hypothetical protein
LKEVDQQYPEVNGISREGKNARLPAMTAMLILGRVPPHFPVEYRLTLDDLKAVYAYLRAIPAVVNPIVIGP